MSYLLQDTNERRRAAALLGLPRYISGEDPSTVIRMCDVRLTNVITKTVYIFNYSSFLISFLKSLFVAFVFAKTYF